MAFINHSSLAMTLLLAIAAPSVLTFSLVDTGLELTNNETIINTSDGYRTGSIAVQIGGYNFTDDIDCIDRVEGALFGQFRFMAPEANETHAINHQKDENHYERIHMIFKLVGYEVSRDNRTEEPDLIADFSGHVDYYYRIANETVALNKITEVINTTMLPH